MNFAKNYSAYKKKMEDGYDNGKINTLLVWNDEEYKENNGEDFPIFRTHNDICTSTINSRILYYTIVSMDDVVDLPYFSLYDVTLNKGHIHMCF